MKLWKLRPIRKLRDIGFAYTFIGALKEANIEVSYKALENYNIHKIIQK